MLRCGTERNRREKAHISGDRTDGTKMRGDSKGCDQPALAAAEERGMRKREVGLYILDPDRLDDSVLVELAGQDDGRNVQRQDSENCKYCKQP